MSNVFPSFDRICLTLVIDQPLPQTSQEVLAINTYTVPGTPEGQGVVRAQNEQVRVCEI